MSDPPHVTTRSEIRDEMRSERPAPIAIDAGNGRDASRLPPVIREGKGGKR